jgi:hypothetical protein
MIKNFFVPLIWTISVGALAPVVAIFGMLNHIPLTLIYCLLVWLSFCVLKKIEIRSKAEVGNIKLKSIFLLVLCLLSALQLWRIFFSDLLSLVFPNKEDLISLFKYSENIFLSTGILEGVLVWGYVFLTYGKHGISKHWTLYLRFIAVMTVALFLLTTLHVDGKWLRDVVGYY